MCIRDSLHVAPQRIETHPPLGADLTERDAAFFQQLDEVGPRDSQQVSGLLGAEFGVDGQQRHGPPLGHLGQRLGKQPQDRRREGRLDVAAGLWIFQSHHDRLLAVPHEVRNRLAGLASPLGFARRKRVRLDRPVQ